MYSGEWITQKDGLEGFIENIDCFLMNQVYKTIKLKMKTNIYGWQII